MPVIQSKIETGECNMKRLISLILCAILLLGLACAPEPAGTGDTAAPVATAVAAAPEPTPEPTAGPLGLAPVDLLGKAYNPFYDVAFPAGYTVFGAQFNSADSHTGAKDTYLLDLTAQGNPADIAKACAGILGVTDEAQLSTYAASVEKDGFASIDGTFAGSPANVVMKKTSAGTDFDQCIEVDGCRVEFAVEIDADSAKNCCALVLANYSTAALGDLAEQMGDDTIHQDQLSIFVNTQKPEKTTVYIYHSVKDAAALFSSAKETLQINWFDEEYSSVGLQYGRQNLSYTFNQENNVVQVNLSPNDNATPAGQYRLSEKSLTKLGFQYDQNAKLCIFEDKSKQMQIAVSKPEWQRTEEDWNLMYYLGEYNGYGVYITYREAKQAFTVMVSQGDTQTGCDYIPETNTFSQGWPADDMMQEFFQGAMGTGEGDAREGVFALFTKELQDRFGMTWQELYALPVW